MKYLRKLICISSIILVVSLSFYNVQAAEISAEDYYNTAEGYSYSQPYEALRVLSEAHSKYPSDKRFTDALDERAKIILNWSKGSQLNGKYDGAIDGYNIIIKTDGISETIKDEANICSILAKRGEQGIVNRLKQPEYFNLAAAAQKQYMSSHYEYQSLGEYNTFGNYLLIENTLSYSNSDEIKFDKDGIPMVNYSGEFYYNPITTEQYALTLYNEYLKNPRNNREMKDKFLKVSNWLIDKIDVLGAFRYPFYYKHYLNDDEFKPGWVSSMAQGQALSVFARAYNLTNNKKYIHAGNSVFRYLIIRTSSGGVTDNLGSLNISLSDYPFFQLYVTNPPSYTLNGHMFTLIGLYDWSNLDNNDRISNEAKLYFNNGFQTLKYILPYYDIGGFVTYDLGYLTKPNTKPTINYSYYGIHITLLDALYRITQDKTIYYYRNLWTSYIEKS
ncbi:D-glucuronyl C5-epimerase family protein [Clostridium sp. DJ247]|uniref:D-glucuronyl C5-epimerase family protein n=1 Tax=Clostridium sp. DJ247 TaxID=2726188 RepID=UPI00162455D6|nr:D-glucuronyl C5-epimerase family protein [Clostridium sp. DJ247]MBC2582399.1 hypothetical protein [Clostridium sp. DJ247]